MIDAYAVLINEYEKWCRDNGLPLLSADELLSCLCDVTMPIHGIRKARIDWLTSFIARWEAVDDKEDAYSDL